MDYPTDVSRLELSSLQLRKLEKQGRIVLYLTEYEIVLMDDDGLIINVKRS